MAKERVTVGGEENKSTTHGFQEANQEEYGNLTEIDNMMLSSI